MVLIITCEAEKQWFSVLTVQEHTWGRSLELKRKIWAGKIWGCYEHMGGKLEVVEVDNEVNSDEWKLLSHVWLFETPWTVQAPPVHGILQERILEWVAMPFCRGWNPGLLHCRQIVYCLSHQGSPKAFYKHSFQCSTILAAWMLLATFSLWKSNSCSPVDFSWLLHL